MNIGIFSGSFNPIHIGHLILANYITEFSDIDQIWFLVTPLNPLKENKDLLDEDLRLKMAQIAIKGFEKLSVSDFEFHLPKPSYTIHTLQELKKKHKQHTFSLIIGADNWSYFDKWKDGAQIIEEFDVYVYPRLNFPIIVNENLREKVKVLNSPIIEISSTFIRNSLKSNKNIQAFVPNLVYKYIQDNNLYI